MPWHGLTRKWNHLGEIQGLYWSTVSLSDKEGVPDTGRPDVITLFQLQAKSFHQIHKNSIHFATPQTLQC